MRTTTTILMLSVLMAVSCGKTENQHTDTPTSPPQTTVHTRNVSVGKLVTTVRKCSRLYVTECHVHKIITHEDQMKLKGSILGMSYDIGVPVGSRSIAIPINGTLKAYIDFSDFDDGNVVYDGDQIEIVLPDPQVELVSTKIDRDEVKSYIALLRSNFSDKELTEFEAQGRESIIASVGDMRLSERARASASRILIPLIHQLGFPVRDISVTFRSDFDDKLIRVTTD